MRQRTKNPTTEVWPVLAPSRCVRTVSGVPATSRRVTELMQAPITDRVSPHVIPPLVVPAASLPFVHSERVVVRAEHRI